MTGLSPDLNPFEELERAEREAAVRKGLNVFGRRLRHHDVPAGCPEPGSEAASRRCRVCGQPIRYGNLLGICTRTPACQRARYHAIKQQPREPETQPCSMAAAAAAPIEQAERLQPENPVNPVFDSPAVAGGIEHHSEEKPMNAFKQCRGAECTNQVYAASKSGLCKDCRSRGNVAASSSGRAAPARSEAEAPLVVAGLLQYGGKLYRPLDDAEIGEIRAALERVG